METETEALAICVTVGEDIFRVSDGDAHEYHNKEPGDEVPSVRKYEPISPGSSTFDLTRKVFFIDTMDVRALLGEGEFFAPKMATRSSQQRVLCTDAKQRILRLIPTVSS